MPTLAEITEKRFILMRPLASILKKAGIYENAIPRYSDDDDVWRLAVLIVSKLDEPGDRFGAAMAYGKWRDSKWIKDPDYEDFPSFKVVANHVKENDTIGNKPKYSQEWISHFKSSSSTYRLQEKYDNNISNRKNKGNRFDILRGNKMPWKQITEEAKNEYIIRFRAAKLHDFIKVESSWLYNRGNKISIHPSWIKPYIEFVCDVKRYINKNMFMTPIKIRDYSDTFESWITYCTNDNNNNKSRLTSGMSYFDRIYPHILPIMNYNRNLTFSVFAQEQALQLLSDLRKSMRPSISSKDNDKTINDKLYGSIRYPISEKEKLITMIMKYLDTYVASYDTFKKWSAGYNHGYRHLNRLSFDE